MVDDHEPTWSGARRLLDDAKATPTGHGSARSRSGQRLRAWGWRRRSARCGERGLRGQDRRRDDGVQRLPESPGGRPAAGLLHSTAIAEAIRRRMPPTSLLLRPDCVEQLRRPMERSGVRATARGRLGGERRRPTRRAAYRAVDDRVDSESACHPWAYGAGWWLVRAGLRGLGNLTTGLLDLGRVSWDPWPAVRSRSWPGRSPRPFPWPRDGRRPFSRIRHDERGTRPTGRRCASPFSSPAGRPTSSSCCCASPGRTRPSSRRSSPRRGSAGTVWDTSQRPITPHTGVDYQWRGTSGATVTLSPREAPPV